MTDERFPTKVDTWLALVVGVGVLVTVVAVVAEPHPATWLGSGVTILAIAAFCWPCHYTFTRDTLLVRSGLIVWKVPYREIFRAVPSRSPLSSPAWSLDRVQIDYGSRSILVSPERQDEFLTELAMRAGLKRMRAEPAWTRVVA